MESLSKLESLLDMGLSTHLKIAVISPVFIGQRIREIRGRRFSSHGFHEPHQDLLPYRDVPG